MCLSGVVLGHPLAEAQVQKVLQQLLVFRLMYGFGFLLLLDIQTKSSLDTTQLKHVRIMTLSAAQSHSSPSHCLTSSSRLLLSSSLLCGDAASLPSCVSASHTPGSPALPACCRTIGGRKQALAVGEFIFHFMMM